MKKTFTFLTVSVFASMTFGTVFAQSWYDYPSYNNYSDQGYYYNYYPYESSYSYGSPYVSYPSYYPSNYTYYSPYNYGNYNTYNNNSYYSYSTLTPTTYAATNASQSTATVNGYVSVSGNVNSNYSNYGSVWFEYGTNYNSLYNKTNPANVYGNTNVDANLRGLTCGQVYYFRVATSGQNGTTYGNTLSFQTQSCYTQNYYNNYLNYPYSNYTGYDKVNTNCYNKRGRYYR
jgi:hypothetical protein